MKEEDLALAQALVAADAEAANCSPSTPIGSLKKTLVSEMKTKAFR